MSIDELLPSEIISFFRSSHCVIDSVQEARSAQHLMFIAAVKLLSSASASMDEEASQMRQKIQQLRDYNEDGSVLIMLRVWKGSARWWSFNRTSPDAIASLAVKEVSGYLAAHRILVDEAASSDVIVPQLLYFSHAKYIESLHKIPVNKNTATSWAALSFLGESSSYFKQQHQQKLKYHDRGTFAKQMVMVRQEFGFDEPHPRHGRVSVEQALPYALKILDHVVLPIHIYLFRRHYGFTEYISTCQDSLSPLIKNLSCKDGQPYNYEKMLQKCQEVYQNCLYSSRMGVVNSMEPNSAGCNSDDRQLQQMVDALHLCILQLEQEYYEWQSSCSSQLPPVLCHCDLQPQNVIFWIEDPIPDELPIRPLNVVPNVACILDWEEASWADPRFELILLCRKICANMEQAMAVWMHYTISIANWAVSNGVDEINVGPIEPWLKLEAVHSLTIFLLQTKNLSGRGVQWERKRDLFSKIDRELNRLASLGWTFCKASNCSTDKH